MTPSQASVLIGRIALTYKVITPEQLQEATRIQGRYGNQDKLGEILLSLGYINRAQLDWLLRAQEQVIAKQRAAAAGVAPKPAGSPAAAPRVAPVSAAAPPAAPRMAPVSAPVAAPVAAPPRAPPSVPSPPLAPAPASRTSATVPPTVAPTPRPAPPSPPAPAPPARAATAAAAGGRELDRILARAVELHASDVHVHSGTVLQLRVHGQLVQMGQQVSPADAERMIGEILSPADRERFAATNDLDFAYVLPGVARFRVNVYRQQRGVDAVLRIIPSEPPTLEQLGLPSMLARLTTFHQGLVLITGPAGCGKSSTLAALVNLINEERKDHIITIEDPLEYVHRSKRCLVNQRQIVRHTASFAAALRAALREDPDVIAIGELRDLETVSLAITAAETGHLVLATLHTNNAIRTINRVLDVFPPSQQSQIRSMLAESLRAVVSQRLVPTLDGRRRVPALELLFVNTAVANLIRDDKTFQIASVLQTGRAAGMTRLDDSLAELVAAQVVAKDVARRFAEDPRHFA